MLNQFSRTELLIGKENIEKLANAKVAIFGIGGVGSFVVEGLVRAGVQNFVLVDDDKICLTNLNRQLIATRKTIGKNKVDVAKERILDINPNAIVETHQEFFMPDNKKEILDATASNKNKSADSVNNQNSNENKSDDSIDYQNNNKNKSGDSIDNQNSKEKILDDSIDYIVDCVDTVTAKIELVMQANKLGVPIISCMGTGNKLDPTAFEITDIYKTSVCPLAKVMRKELRARGVKKLKVLYSKEEPIKPGETDENSCKYNCVCPPGTKRKCTIRNQVPGSISFVPSVAGLIIAGEVVKDLIK